MFSRIKDRIDAHYAEVYSTIKLEDIEEKFDLIFSRSLGLVFAKIGYRWNMTPTQVSIISLIFGVIGGMMFFYQNILMYTITGSILVTLAGVLDSADGQLARMSKQSSELGRIIDGLIDNFVFISCYIFATLYFVPIYGWWVWIFATFAGMAQSTKSTIYDFYKSEYMYFGGGLKDTKVQLTKSSPEASIFKKAMFSLYNNYTNKQFEISTRKPELRNRYEKLAYDSETQDRFQELYRSQFKEIMSWWAFFCGTNFHRTLIMFFSIIGRFDIYIGINIVTYIPMYVINYIQKRKDNAFLKQLNSEFGAE